MDQTTLKKCTKCGECKSASMFYKQASAKDGLHPHCKVCSKSAARARTISTEKIAYLDQRVKLADMGLCVCTLCGETKPLSEYNRREDRPHGLGIKANCKACVSERSKKRYAAMSEEERRERSKKRYAASADRQKAKKRDAYHANPELHRQRCREWRQKNHEYAKQKMREWYYANKERANAASREHYRLNKDLYITGNRRRKKDRLQKDPVFAMSERIRSLIYIRLRAGGYTKKSKSQEILGCDWQTFAHHIERQFHKGMSWENKGDWCLDHIIPLATAKTEEDVIRLNHYTNLRPLWAKDNLEKADKVLHLL